MPEYIERESLISNLKDLPEQERIEYMGIYDCIKSQHTADVAEVVKCKNCKNYELMKSNNTHFCNEFGGRVTEEDFCSRGERKEGDEK